MNNKLLIVSTHVIFWARAACMLSRIGARPAEGCCFCLALSNVFSPGPRVCRRLPSHAREHGAASPLFPVTAAATPLAREYSAAPSPASEHAHMFSVCFILCDRPPLYRVRREPNLALAWRLYQVTIVSQGCE